MFLDFISNVILGKYGGLRHAELKNMAKRQPFSDYFPYIAYDPETECYLNQDDTTGLLWECAPITFAGEKTIKMLEGLFRAGLPMGSVLQLILHADPHIDPILDQYRQVSSGRTGALIDSNREATLRFFDEGRHGVKRCSEIPVRNFRLFVAAKFPANECSDKQIEDIKRQIAETLHAAKLQPKVLKPSELLEWCRRLINHYPDDYPECNFDAYDNELPIRKQIITSDTVIRDEGDHLLIGDNYFCCITPKMFPKEVDPLQTNTLFGGIWGVVSDADQIKTGFLYALNIIFEPLNAKLHAKCNLVLNQQAVGSLSPSLRRKQDEYLTATDNLERGVQFVRVMPVFWVYCMDQQAAKDSITRVRRIWENNGYTMQQDRVILKILFLSSLPFGLYAKAKNLQYINRDFIAPVPTVTTILPVQGDFRGAGAPKLLFMGRKGQLATLDFFDSQAINQNVLCCAISGAGKSFLVNFIAFNYYASGALIRIVDIGGSYKKITRMLGANFLDFHPDSNICLNPFTHIIDPDEELKSVTAVFAQMVYSNSDNERPDDTEMNLVRNAVRWAWKQRGNKADSDTVYEFLMRFPDVPDSGLDDLADNQSLVETARKLAFNIREFTSQGAHGRFFTGPSTFDIRNDDFVVLELENLKVQPDLYRVVSLLVINAVTQDLYLSDRSRPRLNIFDEAWQFLGSAAMMAPVISEGYRRARKYGGGFLVITQSILDLESFGDVGDVIRGNSAFKIFLESPDFDAAKKKGLIDYDDFTLDLLKSVKSSPPNYSELFCDTPFGAGVLRLVVNEYAYYIFTSKADEIAAIESLVRDGKSYDEAIREMLRPPGADAGN